MVQDNDSRPPKTLAEIYLYLDTPELRKELEEYRIAFEERWGHTDPTIRYTSMLPREERERMLSEDPKSYFDGLPPFVKAFLSSKLSNADKHGRLHKMPKSFLKLYLNGQMELTEDDYRGR